MSARILALDTATEACSAALLNQQQIDARFEIAPRDHTQRILPLVQELLQAQSLELSALDALAFGRGPGSFTGVRIGIGIAQGLALGANLPMIGVSSLATMAQGAWRLTGATRVLAAIDARMGEVYWAEYQRDEQGEWQGAESEAVLKPEAAQARIAQLSGEWATVGTGWQAYPQLLAGATGAQLLTTTVTLPAAEDMLPLALSAWQRGDSVAVENAEPVYLRNEVAWKKLPGR
ncbi:tRNA (adenosine(37)-N6)-threonylcarbamoyltransferase complex dimerization subunit type 1 TsaB [Pantoea dispersa]|uniref:tRNA (adenosine(37)-N6)-threonylcarbamoyltransferase complex dimerization subunit type 1 TsaB n=1 Tax=Pantoea dispersa TaxID=59814 RepID=UPI000F69128F|nr:tRNA (adenosine(37)-N6)-threonylcarbamoyltransferase complex dimerization subunit type 1 TsaB [Pantoea dispersa]MBS0903544.1 tRNA (adenosine(37)-N6)-threonylcarbamoyltransferase complex dimerization subunit type 1 TsaB [Pantoea dispersa]RRW72099.1 tRNA (adenosine(37)-N6)-threonylcarbamoyltransferase complex dimerization subunit type 1 TsaB [Pantoea dispersa]WEA07444.1 tRNA (adenosine(37)-N6)-threonylcarbamoyltransferase complex dimerization subunit type 1 TsaB [Pantoea dispersa]